MVAPPGEHPLLEFSHPALAVTGLACWFMYVFVRYTPFAWISFGILMVAIAIGLTWLVHNLRAARHRLKGAWHFPPRLVLLHGHGGRRRDPALRADRALGEPRLRRTLAPAQATTG